MAKNIEIKVDKKEIQRWLKDSKEVKKMLTNIGDKVAREAKRTASDAENGAGGTITGYKSAGFKVEYDTSGKIPVVKVVSNADGETATAAQFNSQRKNGIAHLRAALYKFTTTNKVKRYPIGKPYDTRPRSTRN